MDSKQIEQAVVAMSRQAKDAARKVRSLPTQVKNAVLLDIASALEEKKAAIFTENGKDLQAGKERGMAEAMLNRLAITEEGIAGMAQGLREVASLEDPVGEVAEMRRRPSGILVGRMRVPLGVILMIYESRPNVTIDAAALCLKAGNVVILRGGSEAIHSNTILAAIMQEVLAQHGVDAAAVQVLPFTDRQGVDFLLQQEEYIDLVIPRGGEGLIRAVTSKSRIPVLKHYKGVCHAYVDASAQESMALDIIMNSKTQRPGVCNALEGLLVHEEIAPSFLPQMAAAFTEAGVRMLGCEKSCALVPAMTPASEEDWGTEFLDLALVIRVVADMDEAMDYIAEHGSQHTEIIVTQSYENGQRFLREVDASAVMINAATRFNDGGQFGLGAEIGISTTKLHAYGPMGLQELTTRKFIVYGEGEVRA